MILHGVNMVNKLAPYHPAALGFGERDAAFLEAEGFNTVRLGIIWTALEPEPGVYDDAYLDEIAGTAKTLGGHGIRVLVDFHQDMLNERFNGEGFPDWAIQDDGIAARPDIGFPGNYFVMRALWRAYDHFWDNDPGPGGVGLQDRFAAAWGHAAERLRDVDAVLGYDVFNEPFPGRATLRCARPRGDAAFDAKLSAFYRRAIAAIRKADTERVVFVEPNVLFNTGSRTHLGDLGDGNLGFSFHDYCPAASPAMPRLRGAAQDSICRRFEQRVFDHADGYADGHGAALVLSEFGATDDLRTIARMVDLCDRNMVSWQYWAYWNQDPCCERPEEVLVIDIGSDPVPGNVHLDKLELLARPYPRAVAGTPLNFSHDGDSGVFELTYSTNPPDGVSLESSETEVHLPARHYRNGYEAEVGGATIASAKNEALLRLLNDSGADLVTLRVAPA